MVAEGESRDGCVTLCEILSRGTRGEGTGGDRGKLDVQTEEGETWSRAMSVCVGLSHTLSENCEGTERGWSVI